MSHSIIHGLTRGSIYDIPAMNNLGDDPLFVNPHPPDGSDEDADFRLQARSPAIDAGENSLLPDPKEFPGADTDLDGQPRIVDGDGDGIAIVDLGAYEHTGETPVPPGPDLNGDGIVDEQDLLLLLAAWGPCAQCTARTCPADFTSDCKVGVPDLLAMLASWG